MKFTFGWLKEHINIELSPYEIADKLTTLGIEVEDIIDYSKILDKIIVGKILTTEQHPNANKLHVCSVDIGLDKPLQIVCGAPNARAGIYVAVSLPGAIIPSTQTTLKKGSIRGIESQGMMCSAEELCLDLEYSNDGIIELPSTVTIGQPIAEALELTDVIYDVSITPNRGDLFCVRGIARQLSAKGYGTLRQLNIKNVPSTIENCPVKLKCESNNCEYFSVRAIKNFKGNTPDKIARRLKLCGQKLISCPVDIANYVCFDIGQPMHVFDLDKLPSTIYIRDAKEGEQIKTLAGKIETLPDGALIASTECEPISIVGIIGGESTAVSENSINLLIESSYFNKIAITKTGQALHLSTDARTRFERGVDPKNVTLAQTYFINLLNDVCGGITVSDINAVGNLPENKHKVALNYKKFHDLLGFSSDDFKNSSTVLQNLGCKILEKSDEFFTVETPSWRHDLQIEEDLIEEILQIKGFDGIKANQLPYADAICEENLSDSLLDALIYNGYQECKTFSIIDKQTAEMFSPSENVVHISDALSSEFGVLRTSLVASHLKAILNAQNKTLPLLKIAEIGKQFLIKDKKIVEENVLIGTIAEIEKKKDWSKPSVISVFDIKKDVSRLINMITTKTRLVKDCSKYYHPGRSGSFIYQKDTCLAQFGEIHPVVLDEIGIKCPVYCFELFLDRLPENRVTVKPLSEVSPYQPVLRDFSFLIDKSITAGTVIETIKKLHINEIKNINIFDVYEATSLGDNKKAVAFELTLQSDQETLSDELIKTISDKVINSITVKCNGILRDK